MKNPSPREISYYTSGILSFALLSALILFNQLFGFQISWVVILSLPIFCFVVSFFIFGYFLETFIYRKIKLIYKNIHSLKSPKKIKPGVNLSNDIIGNIEKEVADWTKDKTDEIEDLKKMAAYRKEFLGNVSHELKTPIFNIQGYLHTLIDGGLHDEKINKTYLNKAAENLDRLNHIVQDLEVISQIESNSLILEITKFDILKLIKKVFENMEMSADLKGISLKFKEGMKKEVLVMADRERITQVLINLISNSIKYGKENGNVTVGIYDMDENVLVELTDDGIGVEEKHLPRVFERFYRVDKSRSRELGGTGLGLSIVKHIIEAHNQTVNARSAVGVGSTFGFTLRKA